MGLGPNKTSLKKTVRESTKHGFTNPCKPLFTGDATPVTGVVVGFQSGPFTQPGKLPFGVVFVSVEYMRAVDSGGDEVTNLSLGLNGRF